MTRTQAAATRATARQISFDELGTPLHEVTFVVVDLETTGSSPEESDITEFGAVKVRAGQVLGEFQTLVRPGEPIPAMISVLTGITDAMVATAPGIGAALAAFLEFAEGTVLVAHNARFDIGFLKAACERTGRTWPAPAVIDTVALARGVVNRDEAGDHRLASLARLFRSPVRPDHRALTDARATVHVLHALLERLGSIGVDTLEELAAYSTRVPESTRRKRHLADDLPAEPGVYMFRDGQNRVLYVGTSRNIRARVRTYFTATEKRTRMNEMVAIAETVTPIVCASALEARVRELRLIAEYKPPYNRRSRFPERAPWVKLTAEPYPRLSVVRSVMDDGATYLGPFGSRRQAELAVAAVHSVAALRQCTPRLPLRPSPGASACMLAEIDRCGAPCTGDQDLAAYAEIATAVRRALTDDLGPFVEVLLRRAADAAAAEHFEEAARHRDRMLALIRAAARTQRLRPLAETAELLAALPRGDGGWELTLIRYGRLAGAAVTRPGLDPRPGIEALRAGGEVVGAPIPPMTAAHPEESEQLLTWLEQPGVRLVELEGTWACPVHGAGGQAVRLASRAARPSSRTTVTDGAS